jgi:Fe-S-cluster containining protein
MRGTDDGPPRCIALAGEIGGEVRCTIYDRRPAVPRLRALRGAGHRRRGLRPRPPAPRHEPLGE